MLFSLSVNGIGCYSYISKSGFKLDQLSLLSTPLFLLPDGFLLYCLVGRARLNRLYQQDRLFALTVKIPYIFT